MSVEQIPLVRSYRVGVCVPVRTDLVSAAWAYDFGKMMAFTAAQRPDIELRQYFAPGHLMPQDRDDLVQAAIKDRCTHVLFLATDVRFPRELLIKLLAHELPVCAVNYTTARAPYQPSALAIADDILVPVYTDEGNTGLEKVRTVGLDSILIETRLLEAIDLPRFHYMWSSGSKRFLSDEMYFCEQVYAKGGHVVIDHDLSKECTRIGPAEQSAQNAVLWAQMQMGEEKAR